MGLIGEEKENIPVTKNKPEVVEIADSDATNSDIDDDAFQTLVGDNVHVRPVVTPADSDKTDIDNASGEPMNTSNSLFDDEFSQDLPTFVDLVAPAGSKRKSDQPGSQPKRIRTEPS